MILSTLDKSRKGGAYEQIPSLVLGQRWTPQLNSRNMMKVVLCVWIEPYIENDLSFCVWPVHTPTTSKEVLTLSASTSPLPYTGNKSCIVNTILSVMPKHTVYIDPCMGSAEVFFRKPRAEKEILNDYNGDLVNLFRVIQNNEKLAYLLGRLYLSINGELAFKQNKDRLKGVPNILDDVIETSQIFYDASWEDIQNAAAFLENQVYSFSSTGQTFGIARRDMSQRLPRLMSAYNRIRDAIILHRDYKDVITYAACPGSFILLDPPYKGTEDMYSKANFDIEQHDILFSFIFCHYNGYPDDNGAILAEHYDKQEKVESLIQLGDLYFLRSKLEPNPDLPHNHSTPQPNVTIAYNRDEGWSDCEAVHKTLDELNDPGEIGIEFTYIFTFEGRWIYFPTGEAELGFRDVKEDLDNDTVQYDSFFTEHENNMDWPDNGDFALDTDLRL